MNSSYCDTPCSLSSSKTKASQGFGSKEKQEWVAAAVFLPSAGGQTGATSTELGEGGFQCVEGSCAVSGGGGPFGLVGILLG